jgi:hypothetical protein
MPTEDGNLPVELKPNHYRLLTELALFGGVQIVRHGRDRAHYDALEAMHYLKSTELAIKSIIRWILHKVGAQNAADFNLPNDLVLMGPALETGILRRLQR